MGALDKLNTAVAKADNLPAEKPKVTLRQILEAKRDDVARALPAAANMNPERLLTIAHTLVTANPQLGECTGPSLLGALMTTAQLGLEPGPLQHVYFIPRWSKAAQAKEVNFQIGYKGMVELARRAGVQIRTREVYANDEFRIEYGLEDRIVHTPTLRDRGDVIGYYLVATWRDGAYVLWMNKDDVDKIRRRSDSSDRGPWVTDYDAMARKTLVRRAFASNSIPTTKELAQAVNVDETVRRELTAEAIDITPEERRVEEERPRSIEPAAGRDGRDPGEDDGTPVVVETDARSVAGPDGAGSDSPGSDDAAAVADTLDGVPDVAEAIVEFLAGQTVKALRELAREYACVVPKSGADTDAIEELAARVLERRLA
jgi:recombination protein RecT